MKNLGAFTYGDVRKNTPLYQIEENVKFLFYCNIKELYYNMFLYPDLYPGLGSQVALEHFYHIFCKDIEYDDNSHNLYLKYNINSGIVVDFVEHQIRDLIKKNNTPVDERPKSIEFSNMRRKFETPDISLPLDMDYLKTFQRDVRYMFGKDENGTHLFPYISLTFLKIGGIDHYFASCSI